MKKNKNDTKIALNNSDLSDCIAQNKKEKPKKLRGKKFRFAMASIAIATILLVLCFFCTAFIGDTSVFSFIENYEFTALTPQNEYSVRKYSQDNFCTIDLSSGDELNVLQLTDIHLGCGFMTIDTDKKVVNEVFSAVKATKPDFIVITGDALSPIYVRSGTKNSHNELTALLMVMDKIGLPWAFCFGNHDGEGTASKSYIASALEKNENCVFLNGDKNLTGNGNYYIKVYNDAQELTTAMFFLDTCSGWFLQYDHVYNDQIEWYESAIATLKNENPTIKTLMFFHIPLPEYNSGYNAYLNGDQNVQLILGKKNEKISTVVQRNFFSVIKKLDSTKWIFCGHEHKNNYTIRFVDSDIYLTYAMSMDFSAYILTKYQTEHRGATGIFIKGGNVTIKQAPQDNGYRFN